MNFQRIEREVALRLALFAGIAGLLLGGIACKDEPVQPPPPPALTEITLTLEDAGVTDVWLRVIFPDSADVRTIALQRDGRTVRTFPVKARDTLLVDEGLEPSRTYRYQAVRLIDTTGREKSNELLVTTMGVSSSAFQWRLDTLGDGGSSVLYDVAIVNDTLVYAAGEIYMRDSLGKPDPSPYGLAVWNGKFWQLKRIMVQPQSGSTHSRVFRGILAFSPTDVWLGDGNAFHWDGKNEFATPYWISGYPGNPTPVLGPNQGIHKFWGTSGQNLYGVGDNGGIAHYNGSVWRKLSSGTSLPIRSIYGAKLEGEEKYEILFIADSYGKSDGSRIMSVNKYNTSTLWIDERSYGLDGIWFVPGKKYIAVGSGVWVTKTPNTAWQLVQDLPAIHTTSISGLNKDDIVICGAFWLLAHFDGQRWRTYFPFSSGSFTSIKMKNNIVVAVGGSANRAIIAIGKR